MQYMAMAEHASQKAQQGNAGLGQLLGAFFGPKITNPADAGMAYLNKIPGATSGYFDPYVDAGKTALGDLQGQYKSLLTDPGSVMNLATSKFTQSPGFDFQMKQAMNAANAAAAAGGTLGTTGHQEQAATLANNLANQDFYNYASKVLGLYDTGIQGDQNITNQGLSAGTSLADIINAALTNQAGMAYKGAENQNQAKADKWGNIVGGATNIANSFT